MTWPFQSPHSSTARSQAQSIFSSPLLHGSQEPGVAPESPTRVLPSRRFLVSNASAMKTGISFHYENALARAVGENGLPPADINSSAAADAVRAFLGRVTSGEVGFPHLPDDTGTARAIMEFAAATRPGIDDVIVVGIGGSALGAYALDGQLRRPH